MLIVPKYLERTVKGGTKEEARKSLADAIVLILEDRRDDGLRGVPADAEREVISVDVHAT